MGHTQIIDTMIKDGLWDAYNNYHMGTTAENICDIWGCLLYTSILAVPAKINCIFENFRGISKFFGGPAGYSAESGKRASKAWRIWLSPTMT